MELLKGQDGTVRSVRLHVPGGKKVFNRSIKHLIPLEIESTPSQQKAAQQPPSQQQTPPQQPPQSVQARRRRNATVVGEGTRRANAQQ